jgi:hypothetical protein
VPQIMHSLSERICSSEDETGGVGPNATDMYQVRDSTETSAIGPTAFMVLSTTSDQCRIELHKIM